jgi:hypothetical protein
VGIDDLGRDSDVIAHQVRPWFDKEKTRADIPRPPA